MTTVLDALKHALEQAKKPPNPDRCWRCGYVGAHDPYCLEGNPELRERVGKALVRILAREESDG